MQLVELRVFKPSFPKKILGPIGFYNCKTKFFEISLSFVYSKQNMKFNLQNISLKESQVKIEVL